MTRRTMIWSPAMLGVRRAWNLLAKGGWASHGEITASPSATRNSILLENSNHKLQFDPESARLVSLRANDAPEQEFVVASSSIPVFVIQYLTKAREFQQIASTSAQAVDIKSTGRLLTAVFSGLGGYNLGATVTIRIADNDPLSYWSISLRNRSGLAITDVQFPFVVTGYHLGGTPGAEALLQPLTTGRFVQAPSPQDLEPDSPHAWQFRPENFDTHHYPGLTFAQFLAYYNDRAGLYIGCQDDKGSIKLIKPVHSQAGGLRLGISHVGDWPAEGDRDLGYNVVLRTFKGDWYDAAGIYRDWSLKQRWAVAPLHKRTDVPGWLLDSPPHIIVRIQGQVDAGPTDPNYEFLPYSKLVPLLEKVSEQLAAPVIPVVMSWERPGPWVYPDCFPPAGGDEALREFSGLAKARGWHVGSYCNGTRWVTGHFWSGYDGAKYFAEQQGQKTICLTHDQQAWEENWGRTWRPSYAGCLGVARTREIAENFVERLIDDGLDWIQFLDQNAACSTFPCFAGDHGHSVGPGKWMNTAMQALLDGLRRLAARQAGNRDGERRIVFSVESPPNELFMPNFQVCDQRVAPPGHPAHGTLFFPLYSFLYHEFLVFQGGFGVAPAPYHLQIRSAYNLVMGEIPGAILTGTGTLLNRGDTDAWWSPWSSSVGSNDDSITMLRSALALRRGKARDYLVYGRMQRPAMPKDVNIVHWESNGQVHDIPAVFHSAWHNPEGRLGIVLANWTKGGQVIALSDTRLGSQATETISETKSASRQRDVEGGKISVSLPPLSCALIERG